LRITVRALSIPPDFNHVQRTHGRNHPWAPTFRFLEAIKMCILVPTMCALTQAPVQGGYYR